MTSGHTDSDTGYMDSMENRTNRKKTRRKRTTNLGPRLKVLNINPMDSGLKVECQMETAKQKTITFEFSTVDIVPDDISAEFVSCIRCTVVQTLFTRLLRSVPLLCTNILA